MTKEEFLKELNRVDDDFYNVSEKMNMASFVDDCSELRKKGLDSMSAIEDIENQFLDYLSEMKNGD